MIPKKIFNKYESYNIVWKYGKAGQSRIVYYRENHLSKTTQLANLYSQGLNHNKNEKCLNTHFNIF